MMAPFNDEVLTTEAPIERAHFKSLLLQNPNYFGTLLKDDPLYQLFQPVNVFSGNTTYEQLTCVGYNPQLKTLAAIIKINQNGGYSGGACTAGSKEYVRFYIDYYRNGVWKDLGVSNFDSHDFNHSANNPLCYAANIAFEPDVQHCCDDEPVLPIVRAILSWNTQPPANQPFHSPVWGNVLDVNIQIAPANGWFCWFKKYFTQAQLDIKPEQIELLTKQLPVAACAFKNEVKEQVNLVELVKSYGDKVQPERAAYTTVVQALQSGTPSIELYYTFKELGWDISKINQFIFESQFNTSFEEVNCVGLNRDSSRLYATVLQKSSYGYAGSLCNPGSREYVAFYMDFGSGWQYMGTSSVEVHDVPVPAGGLSYHVELPVNLAPYQAQLCSNTSFAKVRAILSWNQLPPINDPNYVAPWGDWEEAWVEIRYREVVGNNPIIQTIGTIPVEKINSFGLIDKNIGPADASIDVYDSFSFNGTIPITGLIPVHPDSNDVSAAQLKYKIMLKKASEPDSSYAPVTTAFKVLKDVIAGGISTQTIVDQTATGGFYNYLVDFTAPTIVTVFGDLLGVITVAESDVYEFYIETSLGFRSSHYKIKVDKNAPTNVHITVDGTGDCGSLVQGTPITGTYSIADIESNCHSVWFEFIQVRPGDSTVFTVDGVTKSFNTQIPVPLTGKNGTWGITTDHLRPCGYNIRLYGYDKTLVSVPFVSYAYYFYQQYSGPDTIGFCLSANS